MEEPPFGAGFVVGRNEVNGIELQIVQHHGRSRRQPSFGVSHRSSREAGDRTKVTLFVDQHMTHVPFLCHANKGWVDDRFAVRMVVSGGVTGDFSALYPDAPGVRLKSFIATRMRR